MHDDNGSRSAQRRGDRPIWTKPRLEAVCAGDPRAQREFLRDFGPVLRHDIIRLCPGAIRVRGAGLAREWAEDRLHDVLVFFIAKKRLEGYDDRKASVATYLRFIARRYVLSQVIAEERRLRLVRPGEVPETQGQDPWDDVICRDFLRRLDERLQQRLSKEAYLHFQWAYIEELPAAEIAARLTKLEGREVSVQAVHKRKERLDREIHEEALALTLEDSGQEGSMLDVKGQGGGIS